MVLRIDPANSEGNFNLGLALMAADGSEAISFSTGGAASAAAST